jgi:hypothetical protein
MHQEARQLDVSIAKPIHQCDSVLLKDPTRLTGRLIGDEQPALARLALCIMHQLPCCRCIRSALELHADSRAPALGSDVRISATVRALLGCRRQAGDCPQDAEGVLLEGAANIHRPDLLHSACEYRRFYEYSQASFVQREGMEKSFWTRIGAAWENKDGSLNVKLDFLPTAMDTTLQIRDPKPSEDGD